MSEKKSFSRIEDEIQQRTWHNELSKTSMNLIYPGNWLKALHYTTVHFPFFVIPTCRPIGRNDKKRKIDYAS